MRKLSFTTVLLLLLVAMTAGATTIIQTLQFKRGPESLLPAAAKNGEPMMTTDTHRVFVGTSSGRIELRSQPQQDTYSSATQVKLNAKQNTLAAGTDYATPAAVALKANIASPTFTGTITAPDIYADMVQRRIQSITSATTTLAVTDGAIYRVTLNGNWSPTITAPIGSNMVSIILRLIQDATGSRLVTWPGTIDWGSDGAPLLDTVAGRVNTITLVWDPVSAYWIGGYGSSGFTH